MSEDLELIRRLVEQHRGIRSNLMRAGEWISDLEAMSNLQKGYSGWVLSPTESLTGAQQNLHQEVSSLYSGLNSHFAYEERSLPHLFGDVLMEALLIEHRELRGDLENTRSVLLDVKLEGLSREELLVIKARMRQGMDELYQKIEEHAGKEEKIFSMLQRALEEREQKQKT